MSGSGESSRSATRSRPDRPAEGDLLRLPAGDGRPESLVFVPDTFPRDARTPLAICVHGISRDFEEQIALLRGEASRRGFALLAPHFDPDDWPDYQRLGRRGRGPRADLALDRTVERLQEQIGLAFHERYLIGYSGGAQFVHRYAMAHPDRIRAAVCAAAGWYTFPDPRQRYPYGLNVGGDLAGVRLDPASFLRVPILTAVGDRDVEPEAMRSTRRLQRTQGATRVERARNWSEAMTRAAEKRAFESGSEFLLLEGAGHAFSACVEAGLDRHAFEFFERRGGAIR